MPVVRNVEKAAGNLKFPEGPAYDGKGNVYCSNCDADFITRIDAAGTVSCAYKANGDTEEPLTFRKANGMTFYKDGSLFVCDFGRNAIVRIFPDGHQEIVIDNCEGHPLEAPNDLAFASDGALFFTAPGGSSRQNPIGYVYRYDLTTSYLRRVAEQMAFPNGLAFSGDRRYLYVSETLENRILRFPVEADGGLGKKDIFADLPRDSGGIPDGIAFDLKGNLWVAHYSAHSVIVLSPGGDLIETIAFPSDSPAGPTNIEFAGADLCSVYVTDAGSEALYRLTSDTPGLPLLCAPQIRE